MKRKFIVVTAVLLVIVGSLAGIKTLQIKALIAANGAFAMPPETVSGAEVRKETWETTLDAVGSVSPVQGVVLRAELAGTVADIAFQSGASAERGQMLVHLDTSMEEAQLRSAEAQAELARLNLQRARDLRAQGVISQAELDTNEATFRQSTGSVDQVRATIAKKTIRAPFAGRLGIRSVNLGQYVNAGDPIVSLQSLDPVYVDFNLPEQELSRIRKAMEVRVATDATPGQPFVGSVTALNPEVDASTRNIRVQATVPNRGGDLRPGMFARVELVLPQSTEYLVIPATSVLHAPYGDSVFVVRDTRDEKSGRTVKTVAMTTVRLGPSRGDFVAVTSGLEAGQTVVTSGVFKLRNGTAVVLDNSLAPRPESAPRPANS